MRTPLVLIAVMLTVTGVFVSRSHHHGNASRQQPERAQKTTPGGSPLDEVLAPPQRAAFTRATSDLSLVMYADALPVARGRRLVTAACDDLDRSVPLLAALHGTCAPTLRLVAVTAAARRVCGNEGARCTRLLRRRADAFKAIARADRAYARAVRAEIPKGECRAQIAPIHDTIAAELALAAATDRLADAFDAADDRAAAAAKRVMKKQAKLIDDDLVWYRTRDMAEACNLEPWTFETAA